MSTGRLISPVTGRAYVAAPPPLSPLDGQTVRGIYAKDWAFPTIMGTPFPWPEVLRDRLTGTPYRIVEFPAIGTIAKQEVKLPQEVAHGA